MLRIFGESARDCDGVTRRSFLQAGALGLGGLALPDLLRLRAATGPTNGASPGRGVILFWLSGGPGHMETWDPKPDAPGGFRGPFGAIATSVPGRPLRRADARAGAADGPARGPPDGQPRHGRPHQGQPLDAHRLRRPGLQRPRQHRPAPAVDRLGGGPAQGGGPARACPRTSPCRNLRGGTDNLFHYAAYLGGGANPFVVESDPNDPKYRVRNLTLPGGVTLGRLEDRRRMLAALDGLRREADPKLRDLDAYHQRAFDMLTGKDVAAGLRHRRRGPDGSATATAATPSARAPCWPAGWSRRARRS